MGRATGEIARHETEHRSFGAPNETRQFPIGTAEIVSIGDADVGDEPVVVVDWYGASSYAKAS